MTGERFGIRDGRPTVRIERHYPHPVDRVWRAVTTPEHLAAWFPSPVQLELRVGGAMRFEAFAGTEGGAGTIEELDPPRRLAFRWGTDRLSFELTPADGGTAFALTHSFDDRAGAASFATGWEICLDGLRRRLAGAPAPAPDRGVARHEELVAAFGLDRPEFVAEAGAGGDWTLRWTRQLTCPAGPAWELVVGETGPAAGEPLILGPAPGVAGEPRSLVDTVRPAGELARVELTEGTGHGARLVLTVTGRDQADRAAAVQRWGDAMGRLGAQAAARAAAPA